MAYDWKRDRVVLFGGVNDLAQNVEGTWEYDGGIWRQFDPVVEPRRAPGDAMVYDSMRGVCVFKNSIETWEWNGMAWTNRTGPVEPPPRSYFALAFDRVRGRVVLFGGEFGMTTYNETWEWDGATWAQRLPVIQPPARSGASMTYDSARGRVVLFGGGYSTSWFNDTWEWDGNTWVKRVPSMKPPGTAGATFTYDSSRGQCVLFGGTIASKAYSSDVWEWDGTNWAKALTTRGPEPLVLAASAYDSLRHRMILFGGYGYSLHVRSNTWAWDGVAWTQLEPVFPIPVYRAGMTYDENRKRMVLFGGSDGSNYRSETWEYDGLRWQQALPTRRPGAYLGHILAYDRVRKVVQHWDATVNSLWEWDGSNWTQRVLPNSPPDRGFSAMGYDPNRRRWILFGGISTGNVYLNDTWEFDGTNWVQLSPATSPSPRRNALMAYDDASQRVIMTTGYSATAYYQETWAWDGTNWTYLAGGIPTFPSNIAYDSTRQRLVMLGTPLYGPKSDTAEWTGTSWTLVHYGFAPAVRGYAAMAYDSDRMTMVLFGGTGVFYNFSDTWELVLTNPAGFTPFGSGCPGTSGVPKLGSSPLDYPWLGGSFRAQLTNLASIPSVHLPFVLVGDSRTQWGSTPLPLDLGPFGMPGCQMLTNALVTLPLVNQGGSATWSWPVPVSPGLLGRTVYPQGGVLDPGVNALGVVLSNAAEMRFGVK